MTVWWHSNQRRLNDEKTAIAQLESDSNWLENVEWSLDDSLRLRAIFDILLDHCSFRLQLTYHNTYPSSPPSVAPVEDIRVSGHQYGQGGDLCLQIRPDNWRPDYTGADMIRSAHELFIEEAPDDDGAVTAAPSDHNVPDTISLRGVIFRLYLSKATQHMLVSDVPDRATVKLGIQWCGGNYGVANVHGLEKDDFTWRTPDIPLALSEEGFLHKGVFVHVALNGAALSQISTEEALLPVIGSDEKFKEDSYFCLVVASDNDIILFRKLPATKKLIRYRTILEPFEAERRSGDDYSALAAKRVGIVGLGSLGSKIGASLARTGVGHFVLVDGDILHPGNLERHDADWRDVGLHKADLAARRLSLIDPGIRCDARRTAIGAQVSTEEAGNVNAALDGCDLIVDATAEPDVFNHLAGLIDGAKATLVWGAIYAGGLGGEIGRSRPRKDPNPFHIRDVINQVYDTVDKPPPRVGSRKYYGDDGGSVLTATDADVSAIASLVATLALDALIGREPSHYAAHAYLVGHARGWMFEGPFHVQPILADAPIRTDLPPPDDDSVEKKFVGELIQKRFREIKDRSTND